MGTINLLDSIIITPLKRINVEGGDVLHGIKVNDLGYNGFEEAYFSIVDFKHVKAWKKHSKMTLNLITVSGQIKFVFTINGEIFREEVIGIGNFCRITVPPNIWFGFQGFNENQTNMLLNVSNLIHDPIEAERKTLDQFNYKWK